MAKGGNFENEFSHILSLWYTYGEQDDVFIRTHGSGLIATVRRKKGKSDIQAGDITFQDPKAKPFIDDWNIENKTGYGTKANRGGKIETIRWDFLDMLDSRQKEPVFIKLWNQCQEEAQATNRHPMLVFRRNKRGICIAINRSDFDYLSELFGKFQEESIVIGGKTLCIKVASMEGFFSWADPKLYLEGKSWFKP